jgi:hypothetical protein
MDCPSLNDDHLANAKKLINSLDLTTVIKRLIHIDKWSEKKAHEVSSQYKNFLFLKRKYGDQFELPPSSDIDDVWHAHILHTEDYQDFCMKVFGRFLHHQPHHGENNTISQQQLEHLFETQTQRLYHEEFGEFLFAIKSKSNQIFKRLFKINNDNRNGEDHATKR